MTYFIQRQVGNHYHVDEVSDFDGPVFEENGTYFVKMKCEDIYGCESEGTYQVYKTRREVWASILKDLDDHIAQMQDIRDEVFHKAIDDGGLINKEKASEFIKNLAKDIADHE